MEFERGACVKPQLHIKSNYAGGLKPLTTGMCNIKIIPHPIGMNPVQFGHIEFFL